MFKYTLQVWFGILIQVNINTKIIELSFLNIMNFDLKGTYLNSVGEILIKITPGFLEPSQHFTCDIGLTGCVWV